MTYSMTYRSYRSMRAIGQRSSLPSFYRAYYRVSMYSRSRTSVPLWRDRNMQISHSYT